jgi:DNA-binding NtrC family response regulator
VVPFLLNPPIVMNGEALNRDAGIGRDRVLIVDDDPEMRETLAAVLADAGYAVHVAHNGHDAMGKLAQALPDLVLTDIQMPGMHGLDLVQNLRRIDEALPIVLATGLETRDLVTSAESYGAVACLEKPIDLEELTWTIDLALACRRTLRARGA